MVDPRLVCVVESGGGGGAGAGMGGCDTTDPSYRGYGVTSHGSHCVTQGREFVSQAATGLRETRDVHIYGPCIRLLSLKYVHHQVI